MRREGSGEVEGVGGRERSIVGRGGCCYKYKGLGVSTARPDTTPPSIRIGPKWGRGGGGVTGSHNVRSMRGNGDTQREGASG